MAVRLTVHRATRQIGGNCIEIAADGARIVLDVGRPLDAPEDATGLLPKTLDLSAPVSGLLISHPHQDHYGLIVETPEAWPIHCGAAAARLITLTGALRRAPIGRPFQCWTSGRRFRLGPFAVTPYLTDHSAFDAYMLLIEAGGKRILYTGDFRSHGRKAKLIERMMRAPPPAIDVLLMEGTNLGSDKPHAHEAELEEEFVSLFNATAGRVFVAWSAQNLDRTVTLYRACLKAGRTLVVDLYTAEVLEKLAPFARVPQPDWQSLKVVITSGLRRRYGRVGEDAFVARVARNGISARRLAETPGKWVVMTRPSLARDYGRAGVTPSAADAWSWSMWRGYLRTKEGAALAAWFCDGGARARHIHTSGHASPADLRAFAARINPRWLVPIHGVAWDENADGFPPIRRLADGEPATLD
jgi:ribonuclease J